MIILKEALSIILATIIFSLCLFVTVEKIDNNISSAVSTYNEHFSPHMIILDAGHGGEDSGAVARNNIYEKDINLEICDKISLFFDLFGIKYIKIRDSDVSVGDTSLDTIRKRKASDINKRYEIINSYENSVLLSIHQNMFPVEKYSGLQVFYAVTDGSEILAESIQNTVCVNLQPDNTRSIKKCDSSVYLLHKAKVPSVMVECGFLSNENEFKLLTDSLYQAKLSYFIYKGISDYLISNKDV